MPVSVRALGKRVLAVLLGLTVAVGLTEALLRVFHLAPTNGVITATQGQFDRLPGLFAPGQDLIDLRNPALPHIVHIDSLGYREQDFPRTKPPGEFRILMAGDSHVYGDFVDNDATFPSQLAARLDRRCRGVRVINAGVGGTTIVDEANMIERALPLSIDLVTLVFYENDVTDLALRPMWDELGDNRRAKSRFPLSVAYPVLRRSALWNAILSARAARRARSVPKVPTTPAPADGLLATLRERYIEHLRSLRDSLSARGIPLVFVVYPPHRALAAKNERESTEWASRIGAEAGLPTINLLGALVSTGLDAPTLFLLPHDGHPSRRGYAVATDTLATFLVSLRPMQVACGSTSVRK